MNFIQGMLKAPIRWRVTLKRKGSSSKAGQEVRRRVEEVFAGDTATAKVRALQMYDNAKFFEVESVKEMR